MLRRTSAALVGIALFVVLAGHSGAGVPPSNFSVEPTEALPGDVVTVTGICADDVNNWVSVWFYLDNPGGEAFSLEHYTITAGVPWEFNVTIPNDAPPGVTTVGKQCARLDEGGGFAGGEATQRVEFLVLTPAPVPPTPEPTPEPAPAPDPAIVQPTFTG